MTCHLTRVRVAIIKKSTSKKKKKSTSNKYRRGCGEKESSYTVNGNVNWYNHYGELNRGTLRN